MQCVSCHFENMPGSQLCARCGTSMQLATATIDVHPPRAGPWKKRVRQVLPAQPVYYRLRHAVTGAGSEFAAALGRKASEQQIRLGLLLRTPVPGWPQRYLGQTTRSRWFFRCYVALLTAGLLFFGTVLGSMFLGLAVAVHAASAVDVTLRNGPQRSLRSRLGLGLAVSALLGALIYWPIGRLITRVADPQVIQVSVPPFQKNDVVLVSHWAHLGKAPVPGQVVLYELPLVNAPPQGHQYYVFAGQRIDRILAQGGDRVQWRDGKLWVNGTLSSLGPLNPRILPSELSLTVPTDCYLVFPTTTPYLTPTSDQRLWETLSCVPSEAVQGVAYVRSQPLWRWRVIR